MPRPVRPRALSRSRITQAAAAAAAAATAGPATKSAPLDVALSCCPRAPAQGPLPRGEPDAAGMLGRVATATVMPAQAPPPTRHVTGRRIAIARTASGLAHPSACGRRAAALMGLGCRQPRPGDPAGSSQTSTCAATASACTWQPARRPATPGPTRAVTWAQLPSPTGVPLPDLARSHWGL